MRSLLAVAAPLLAGAAFAEGRLDRFKDPDDGQFDASEYLLDHRGALPVPIIITEPAVGYGGGVALAWFSESIRDAVSKSRGDGRLTPPDIYGLALFATENGTKGAGLGARVSFDQDRWRYRGGLAWTSVNLDFYGIGTAIEKIGYNLKGGAAVHELTRRVGETDHFVGARWVYLDLDTRFDPGRDDAGLSARDLARRSSGLGLTWVYDSRDNIFTTTRGIEGAVDAMFYAPAIGSDNTFQTYRGHVFGYWPAHEKVVVALRADGRAARGDVPFYQLPFIDMRGVPAARYQNRNTAVVEAEGRFYVTPRWIVLAFVGAARAWGSRTPFDDAPTIVSKGAGFRYMIARRLQLSMGLDVAKGPEDTAYYLQVGNAWR